MSAGGVVKAGSAGGLVTASVQDSSTWAAPGAVIMALFVVGTVVFVAGLIIGEESADDDRAWWLWVLCAWLMFGTAFALMSLVAAFWYVVCCAGLALVLAVLKGLVWLFEATEGMPLFAGFSAIGVGVVCLAGAVVSAVTGHPWLALTALATAVSLIGMATGLILQEGRYQLTQGQAETVWACGGCMTAILGLALLVLGPLLALTTSGDVLDRVIRGGAIAAFGWIGLWTVSEISRFRRSGNTTSWD